MRKIFIIDDLEENLVSIKNSLEELIENCEISTCLDSLEAIELARKFNPDVIITDVLMPELDGIELCELFSADENLKNIPIIILSGSNVDAECRIDCLKAGADVFLSKPIDAAELVAQINAMLRIKIAEDELRSQKALLKKQIESKDNKLKSQKKHIQKTEEFYQTLFQNAFDAIIIFDPDTENIIEANDFACNLYGYSREELLLMSLRQLTKDIEKGKRQIAKTLKNGFQKIYQTIHLDKDGNEIYIESNSSVIRYNGKDVILAVMRDITERKTLEEILKESEKKYRTIFEATGTATMLVKDDNAILEINKETEKLSNYSKSEFINQNWIDFVFDDDKLLMSRLFKIKKNKPELLPDKIETRLIDKAGAIRNVVLTVKKIPDSILSVVSLLDITERKKAEEELKQSEKRYRTIFETTSVGVLIANLENRNFIYANPAICEMLGYSYEELTSKNLNEIHPNDSLPYVKSEFAALAKGKKNFVSSIPCLKKDDTVIFTNISGAKTKINGIECNIGFFTDITELRQKDEEIRKLSRVVNQSPSITVITDLDGNIEYASPSFASITGYQINETLGRNPRILKSGEYPNSFYQDLWDTITSGNEWRGEIQNKKKNGEIYWESAYIFPIKNEDNEITNYIKIATEITDSKLAAENLKASEIRFRNLFNATPVSIWEEDFSEVYRHIESLKKKGITDFEEYFEKNFNDVVLCAQKVKIFDVNETTVKMFKSKSKADFIKDLNEVFTEKSLTSFKDELVKIANQETFFEGRSQNVTFDGEVLEILLRWSVIPGFENDYSHVLVTLLDITEKEKAEAKIKALLAEKDMLLHEVHHRIKNNMAAIESLFRIQSRNTEDENVKSAFMDAISRLRGMRVLYDKLYRTDNFRETALKDYLSDLLNEIIQLFPNSDKVKTKTDIDDFKISANLNFPLCIIINELVSNCMKYAFKDIPNDNMIKVTAKMKDNQARIVVQDNGVGLPDDFDLDKSEGFGVKLVKMLADQINGNISFENDNGTKWILEFDI